MAVSALTGRACVCLACANLCVVYSIYLAEALHTPDAPTSPDDLLFRHTRACSPNLHPARELAVVHSPSAVSCGVIRAFSPPAQLAACGLRSLPCLTRLQLR